MAKKNTQENTVLLNDYHYKINGPVTIQSLSPFPERQSIGDDSYSNKLHLSSFNTNDMRGGIGVENMDETIDWNKCWWTNCIIDYKNHIMPPRLATEVATIPTPTIAGTQMFANFNGELYLAEGSSLSKLKTGRVEFEIVKSDFKSAITSLTASLNSKLYIFLGGAATASDDLVTSVDTEATHTSETYTKKAELTVHATGTYRIKFDLRGDITPTTGYGRIYRNGSAVGTEQTETAGSYVTKSEDIASWTAGDLVQLYSRTATAGKDVSIKNFRIYGTSGVYLHMTTGEAFTQDHEGAKWSWQFDNKLFKADTDGNTHYSTNPDAASPTWTTASDITDIASQIESFAVGRDAAGAPQSYCATNSVLKVLDLDTPEWIDTEVKLPNHPIGGQGFTYFNGKLYLSYGLAVKEYYAETGSVRDVGLTERDGLPVEYNGEITKLLGDTGTEMMFALVDSSVTSGNSLSGLYVWKDGAWYCWWADTANNGAMYDVIVSSAESGYAVYWSVGSKVYYIDIPRGIQNPDKISQSYATAGIFISPWFDAGNAVADKLAKSLNTFAKGVTAADTVALKYRTDHDCGDLDSGWTTMDTLNTTAESGTNEELFVSGAGLGFNAIQFRMDFVTAGSTAKADIQSLLLYYKKRTGGETIYGWTIPIVVDNEGKTSAKEKWENLKAAKDSATDILFSYHPNDASTESYYVTVDGFTGTSETGRRYEGNYELTLIQT